MLPAGISHRWLGRNCQASEYGSKYPEYAGQNREAGKNGRSDRPNQQPAYATSVGLLNWAFYFQKQTRSLQSVGNSKRSNLKPKADGLKDWLKRILP